LTKSIKFIFMAADFKIKDGEKVRTVIATKGSSTVIEAGDIVALASGLIVKAGAADTAIAFCPNGAVNGSTDAEVTVGNDFTLVGMKDSDAVFAQTQSGALCDLKGTTDLIVDNDTASTNVFKIGISKSSATVGSKVGIEVRINKPLF
jgi:hypothetical protein